MNDLRFDANGGVGGGTYGSVAQPVDLRQCIERIHINKPASEIKVTVKTVPGGNLQGEQTIKLDLGTAIPKVDESRGARARLVR